MGVIRKQSVQSTIISYAGAAIGFLNKVVIFTELLSKEEVGLANVLLMIAALLVPFASLGIPNTVLRFFPYFRNRKNGHNGALFWILIAGLAGFFIVALAFLALKPFLIDYWSQRSPLLSEYSFYILPLVFFTLFFNLLDSFLRSLYKTVVSMIVKQVFLRLSVTGSVILYYLGWVDFSGFVFWYVALYCASSLFLLVYLAYLRELKVKPSFGWRMRNMRKQMSEFSLWSLLGYSSNMLVANLDSIMISLYLNLASAGVYTTMVYITSMMLMPWRALHKISSPKVADSWKANDMKSLHKLYQRTSLINLIIACFLYLGIWVNRDNIFSITGKEWSEGVWVLLIFGLNRILEMVTGINGVLLQNSRLYRWDMGFSVFLVGTVIISNHFLIPAYGINGAAIASLISMGLFNITRSTFVYFQFKLHPLSKPMIWVLGLAGIAYAIDFFLIPTFSSWFVDLLVRSTILTATYGAGIYFSKASPDLNDFLNGYLKKLSKKAP